MKESGGLAFCCFDALDFSPFGFMEKFTEEAGFQEGLRGFKKTAVFGDDHFAQRQEFDFVVVQGWDGG